MGLEQLLRDIDDLDDTLEKLREWMSFRYDSKWTEQGSFRDQTKDIIISALLTNIMEFVDAVDRTDEEEMSTRAADCISIICMLFRLDSDGDEMVGEEVN